MRACSTLTTSMMTPPLSIWASPTYSVHTMRSVDVILRSCGWCAREFRASSARNQGRSMFLFAFLLPACLSISGRRRGEPDVDVRARFFSFRPSRVHVTGSCSFGFVLACSVRSLRCVGRTFHAVVSLTLARRRRRVCFFSFVFLVQGTCWFLVGRRTRAVPFFFLPGSYLPAFFPPPVRFRARLRGRLPVVSTVGSVRVSHLDGMCSFLLFHGGVAGSEVVSIDVWICGGRGRG